MKEKVRFLGLDVHAETIAVAIAEPDGAVRSLGTIANRAESIRKMVKKLGPVEQLRACYEAGPTGYVLYWQLTKLGVDCAVIAPTLAPMKASDRVKTDRRDAERLARSHRAGDLTAVWVPDAGSEALRDLVRGREAAKQDQLRARHRLGKFLLRSGQRPPMGIKAWTQAHLTWVRQLHYAQPAQEATRLDYLHEVDHMADSVHERQSIDVAPGDRLMLTANRRDAGFRATNGELVTVRGIESGRIQLEDGRTLPANYHQFDHGYAITAHRSQGKTVDGVILSADAMKQELFYVGASRGRSEIAIVTSDREQLRESLGISSARPSATELAREHAHLPEHKILQAPAQQIESTVSRNEISIGHDIGLGL